MWRRLLIGGLKFALDQPATIPFDLFTGQPMKHRRTDDGRFQVYSVGWNGRDNGRKVVMNKDGKAADVTQGDWVWPRYPDE